MATDTETYDDKVRRLRKEEPHYSSRPGQDEPQQSEPREDYKGFKAPRGMSPEQEGRWKAAIDERTKSTIPEAPGALATKALGDPSGMPPTTTGDPALDPDAPRALLEAGSILPVGQAIQAGADVGIMGSDIAEGDYSGAAVSGAAVFLPFISAGVLKKIQQGGDLASDTAAKKLKSLETQVNADQIDRIQAQKMVAEIETTYLKESKAQLAAKAAERERSADLVEKYRARFPTPEKFPFGSEQRFLADLSAVPRDLVEGATERMTANNTIVHGMDGKAVMAKWEELQATKRIE